MTMHPTTNTTTKVITNALGNINVNTGTLVLPSSVLPPSVGDTMKNHYLFSEYLPM